MKVRIATLDDAAAIAHIRRILYPYKVTSVEDQRHQFTHLPERAQTQTLVAQAGGEVVAFARTMLNYSTPADGEGILTLAVLPSWRRQGIGATLLELSHEHLSSIGARVSRAWGPQDEASTGFAAKHGYEATRVMRYSGLDPRQLPPMPPIPPDVRLLSVAEAGCDAVYEFDCVAALDEPTDVAIEMIPREEWIEVFWNAPDHQADMGVAAIVDGVCASATFVEADMETHRSWSGFTGTLPDYRGRGLAKLVKSASLRRAAQAGITGAFTSNDAVNAPMLAVNTWLGYRLTATERSFKKDL